GDLDWSRRQTLPREGVRTKRPGAQNLKNAACCRNAFGQLLQCGLLRVRLVAAAVVLRFAHGRHLALKPVVSELGCKRFHATPRYWITLSVLAYSKASHMPPNSRRSVRATYARF